jgi:two-component system cell cycle sensor histidine kinase/response regulator CckA
MPIDPSALATMTLTADGALALAGASAAVVAFRRRECLAPRPLAGLLGAGAVAGAVHAFAPLAGPGVAALVLALAAAFAWCAIVALWRAAPEAPPTDDAPRLLDAALAACRDGVVIATTDHPDAVEIVYSNPAFEHLTGYTQDEAVGLSPSVLVDEVDSLAEVREALRGTEPVRVEVPGRRKDGTRVWAEWQIVPVADAAGRHTHTVAVLRDTTARRRSEQALRESEERFRGLFEQAADGILVLDPAGRIIDANHRACESLGYTRTELGAMRMAELGAPSSSSCSIPGETSTAESTLCRKDGQQVATEIRYAVSESAGRRFHLAMIRDVTRRREAERALRDREELLRGIITHIPCGVFWKDRASVYLGCNERVAQDYGFSGPEQIIGRSDYDITRDRDEATFYRDCDRAVMESGQPILNLEEYQTRPDGTRATLLTSKVPLCDARGRVVGVLGVYTDITDRKRLEEQLRQAQKMEAVGQLAGGVAHDFNNILTVVRGNAELLRTAPEGAGPALLDDLVLAADRATALVRQLLMFGRRQPTRVEVLDVNEVVTALARLLGRLLGERIAVEIVPAAGPATVRADRSHLEQVVMNLAVNARDAMPNGGVLSVRIEPVERAGARFVRLAITDTGTGMTPEVQARIFEPFFTTKGPDKGTGLGLATVFGIVQQAGGTIEVESAPGAGTTFRVDLPGWTGSASSVSTTPAPRAAERRAARPVSVLLVEDQDAVRRFAAAALQHAGHRVTEAESGEAALEIVRSGEPFDVLITDMMMPGIDGLELAERTRALRPEVAVVLMSGFAPETDREPIEQAVFLQKPFPPADLLAALSKARRRAGRLPESAGRR